MANEKYILLRKSSGWAAKSNEFEFSNRWEIERKKPLRGECFLEDNELKSIKDKLTQLPEVTLLKNNDKIYPSPFSKVPRFKLKNYLEVKKIKIKKHYDLNKVNVLLIDDVKSLIPTTNSLKFFKIPLEDLFSIKSIELSNHVQEHKAFIRNQHVTHVLIDNNQNSENYFSKYPLVRGSIIHQYDSKEREFVLEFIKYINSKSKSKLSILLDSSLNSEINNNSDLPLDKDTFDSLSDLLKSRDVSNHLVAKELLANSNFQGENEKYLFMLLFEFNNILTTGKKSSNYQHFLKNIPFPKNEYNGGSNKWWLFAKSFVKRYPNDSELIKAFILHKLNLLLDNQVKDITLGS